jgi:FkbM family methyltransferase
MEPDAMTNATRRDLGRETMIECPPETALERLLEEDFESVRERETSMVEDLALAEGGPIVLFGAGALGRWTLARLRRAGVEPGAFADNDPNLWGKSVEGLQVMSAVEAAHAFGRDVPFVVTVYTGAKVRAQLRGLGLRAFPFPVLALRFPDALLPHNCVDRPSKMVGHVAAIREGMALWADEASRREYLAQVRYRLTFGEDMPPSLPPSETYFPEDLVVPSPDEVFVDCGAYDGDSVHEFLRRRGDRFAKIIALEPDPQNIARLHASLSHAPESLRRRIRAIPVAAGARRGMAQFDATGTVGSSVGSAGSIDVEVAPLDEALSGTAPTYLKMDIEGAEPDAIAGAHQLLARDEPVLAVCLYHRQEDLWQIPLQIRAINSRYHLFLRRYSDDCWEQVCYAIPRSRLRDDGLAP